MTMKMMMNIERSRKQEKKKENRCVVLSTNARYVSEKKTDRHLRCLLGHW